MFEFNAIGGVDEAGEPVVQLQILLTVPLKDADAIAKIVKIGGTRAVLAVGAVNNGELKLAPQVAEPPHSHEGAHGDECVGEGQFTPVTLGGQEIRETPPADGNA